MTTSVVIPTRNRSVALERTIRALWAQTAGSTAYEVVVVDNVSTDDTPQRIAALRAESPAPLRYVRMDVDRGPAVSRNRGAQTAAGDFILFLDSDVELEPSWIARAVEYLRSNPEVGMVAGKLLYAARRDLVDMFGGELSRLGLGWDANAGEEAAALKAVQERLWTPSAAVLVRRSVIDRIGLFDEAFHIAYEDSDFGWRANLAGFKCVCLAALTAVHHDDPSGHAGHGPLVFHSSKNRLRSLLKNYSTARLFAYLPLYLLYAIVEAALRPSGLARLRALAWNVAHIRDTWSERANAQRVRTRTDGEIAKYFSPGLLPPSTLAGRQRAEWLAVSAAPDSVATGQRGI